jgi:Methyltransferase domain
MAEQIMSEFLDRNEVMLKGVAATAHCLEVAPFHRPSLTKNRFKVDYTDYATTDELRQKVPVHEGFSPDEVCQVDYIWTPGRPLRECIPAGFTYDFALASHVMEHVPNPLGWVQQILDVMKTGATLQLALPDYRGCFDVFRSLTTFPEMLEWWAMEASMPTVSQLFDAISRNVAIPGGPSVRPFGEQPNIADFKRFYSDESALHFALMHFNNGTYMDTHCSVFSPESMVDVFSTAARLGLLNVEISQPELGWREFFVKLTKRGEPKIRRSDYRRYVAPGQQTVSPTTQRDLMETVISTVKRKVADRQLRRLPADGQRK